MSGFLSNVQRQIAIPLPDGTGYISQSQDINSTIQMKSRQYFISRIKFDNDIVEWEIDMTKVLEVSQKVAAVANNTQKLALEYKGLGMIKSNLSKLQHGYGWEPKSDFIKKTQ